MTPVDFAQGIDQSLVLEPHLSSICSSSSKCGYQLLIFFSVGYPPGSTKMVNMDHDWRWISYWKLVIYHCHVIILPPQTMHYHFREIPPKNYQQHLHQVRSCSITPQKKFTKKFHQKMEVSPSTVPYKAVFCGVGFPLQKPYIIQLATLARRWSSNAKSTTIKPCGMGLVVCVLENEVIKKKKSSC